jgi:glycosyltransferase involved in cell wall biosynthesis
LTEKDVSSYLRAADFLHTNNVDLVCLQHEYGIFGGRAGSHILALLRELHMPIVTTLHTILKDPDPDQRRVLQEVAAESDRLVVMSNRGAEFLQEIYHVSHDKIDLIPHGIPDVPFVDPSFHKDLFGVEGKIVLLSFGLLSANKGIENVIAALPAILARYPNVVYMIVGATHPHVMRHDVDNVVFPCGATVAPDGDTLHLYYGAADTSIAMATGSIRAILKSLEKHSQKKSRTV